MLCVLLPSTPASPRVPYTPLFRSGSWSRPCCTRCSSASSRTGSPGNSSCQEVDGLLGAVPHHGVERHRGGRQLPRSEEHTSELQSLTNLVCRLLLEKKKNLHQTHA